MHAGTIDDGEYLPATHVVHVEAPSSTPVLVIEPAAHAAQATVVKLAE